MIYQFIIVLSWLIIGHFFGDMVFQTDTMSKGKNRNRKPDYIPEGQKLAKVWPYFLSAHAGVHAGIVWAITGIPFLALIQFMTHWIIDFVKCENITNPDQDQLLHFIILVASALYFILI